VPERFFATRLRWHAHGHFAVEHIEGEICLTSHQGAEFPLQDGDLLGAIHTTNLEDHVFHRFSASA
jgi:hypothetical protein